MTAPRDLEEFSKRIDELTSLRPDEEGQEPPRKTEGPWAQPGRFRHILVAFDGSEGAQDALSWAQWIAPAHGATVTLALVLPHTPETTGGGLVAVSKEAEGTVKAVMEDDERHGKDLIESVKQTVEANGITCKGVVVKGRPADEIVRLAHDLKADLVVMGPHRKRGLERALMGSVSNTVIQRAKKSVLIARNPAPAKKVLLAVDGSELSHQAAGILLSLPDPKDVRVVSVFPIQFAGFSAQARELMRDATAKLQEAVERRSERSPQPVEYDLLFGKPAERILEVAHEQRPELIVMGARGLSRIQGWFLGSVSNQVVHRARTSVLLVRGQEDDESAP